MPEIVVKQDVTVIHKLEGDDPFSKSVEAMQAMATKLENAFSNISKNMSQNVNTDTGPENKTTSNNSTSRQDGRPALVTQTPIDQLNGKISDLIAALGKFTGGVGNRPLTTDERVMEAARIAGSREEAVQNARLQGLRDRNSYNDERAAEQEDERRASTWRKVSKGMALGAITAAVYQSNSLGATFGSAEGIINTSGSDYANFMTSQYNKRMDAGIGIANTAISGGSMALGAALMPVNPLAGLAVMGIGAGANALLGYKGSEWKAENEFAVNQDIQSWRLQSSGISGASGARITGGGHFTDFQQEMSRSRYAAFYKEAPAVLMAGRRDIVNEMSLSEQADFAGNVQLQAMKMGANPLDLARAASNAAAITGKSTNEIINSMTSNFNAYGGDVVANQNKINALVTGTSMSYETASSIVNRYQYNDAMLQNRVNDTVVSPMNRFRANLMGRIFKNMTGLDIDSEEAKRRYQEAGATGSISPEFSIYEHAMSARGQNVWAKDVGAMAVSDTGVRPESNQPISMAGFADDMAKALQGITLNVNIVGNQAEGQIPDPRPNPTPPLIPKTPMKQLTPQSKSKLVDARAETDWTVPPILANSNDRNIR